MSTFGFKVTDACSANSCRATSRRRPSTVAVRAGNAAVLQKARLPALGTMPRTHAQYHCEATPPARRRPAANIPALPRESGPGGKQAVHPRHPRQLNTGHSRMTDAVPTCLVKPITVLRAVTPAKQGQVCGRLTISFASAPHTTPASPAAPAAPAATCPR